MSQDSILWVSYTLWYPHIMWLKDCNLVSIIVLAPWTCILKVTCPWWLNVNSTEVIYGFHRHSWPQHIWTGHPKVIRTTQPSTIGGPLGNPRFSTLDSTAKVYMQQQWNSEVVQITFGWLLQLKRPAVVKRLHINHVDKYWLDRVGSKTVTTWLYACHWGM